MDGSSKSWMKLTTQDDHHILSANNTTLPSIRTHTWSSLVRTFLWPSQRYERVVETIHTRRTQARTSNKYKETVSIAGKKGRGFFWRKLESAIHHVAYIPHLQKNSTHVQKHTATTYALIQLLLYIYIYRCLAKIHLTNDASQFACLIAR
jgi:hypothetical protein